MKVVILQSNYLPWRGYFDLIHQADIFCFYDEVQYTKNDWRNRNKILTQHGVRWLSIPIAKSAVKLKISEVSFKDSSWQENHFDILYQAYKKAPYYAQLELLMVDFYRSHEWKMLAEFNRYSIETISNYLGIQTQFVNSNKYRLEEGKIERLIALLEQLDATEYITGPSAKGYLQGTEHLFSEKNIKLTYLEYGHYQPYPQLSDCFENFLSIVDLIANTPKKESLNFISGRF